MLVLTSFVLNLLVHGGCPSCVPSLCATIVRADTGASVDTTSLRLTPALLTQVTQVLAEIRRHPTQVTAAEHDSTYVAHFFMHVGEFAGLPADPTKPGDSATVFDWGAVAARNPAVAAAFTHAHLAPARYLPVLRALTNAEATDTLQLALEGMLDDPVLPADSTTLVWRNVAFLRTHRPAIDALGIAISKSTFEYNDTDKIHFLDTVALARHLPRLREVTDPSAGFPLGFLDSSEAPGGAARVQAPPLRILFVGNSLTYFNEMPRLFSTLAAAGLHRRVVVGLVSLGSASPYVLWTFTDVTQVMAAMPWDAIVVQMKPRSGNTRANFERYARLFTQAATAHHARTVLWTEYAGLNTAGDVQATIDTSLASAARTAGATVAPVSAAWAAVRQANDATWRALYYSDDVHPSALGSYLLSLVMYRTLTGHSPVGLPAGAGTVVMPDSSASLLQHAISDHP